MTTTRAFLSVRGAGLFIVNKSLLRVYILEVNNMKAEINDEELGCWLRESITTIVGVIPSPIRITLLVGENMRIIEASSVGDDADVLYSKNDDNMKVPYIG